MIAIVDYGAGNLNSVKKAFDHLGAEVVLGGQVAEHARLVDRVGQRLLAVDVLLHLDRHHAGDRVRPPETWTTSMPS